MPPYGIRIEPAPMVLSKRSTRPRREAQRRLEAISRRDWKRGFASAERSLRATRTPACLTAPLVLRKARLRSAMTAPFHSMTMRASSVTTAT